MTEFRKQIINSAKKKLKRIVFPETNDDRILKAAEIIAKEKIAIPILLGNPKKITERMQKIGLNTIGIIFSDITHPREDYIERLHQLLSSKIKSTQIKKLEKNPLYYAAVMVEQGDADGVVAGSLYPTTETLKAALKIIGTNKKIASSYFIMLVNKKVLFFADCAFNIEPTSEQLAEIAHSTAQSAKSFGISPKIAMLSFSTKGSAKHVSVEKVIKATQILKKKYSGLIVDGELQVDAALVPAIAKMKKSSIKGDANVLIFPDLNSGNIAYKLVERLASATAIGPITQGFSKPINDLSRGCSVDDIVLVAAITAIQAKK